MKETLVSLLNFLGLAFWVEINTENPRCIYYFGPFLTFSDAESAKAGYVEDLQQEATLGITVQIKRCKPKVLTVYDEVGELRPARSMALFISGQP